MKKKLQALIQYLQSCQARICSDNECTEEEHKCESYAYIDEHYDLMDLCNPDFFQGSSKPYAVVPLPLSDPTTVEDFKKEIDDQITEQLEAWQ